MSTTLTPELIEKESIPSLHFPNEDVLTSKDEKNILIRKLQNATTLGNIEHNKCKIIFKDSEGVKAVETTIWATADKNIVLKQGVVIPIHRILDVRF